MTIDTKYNQLIHKASLALDTFTDVEPEALKLMRSLLPQEKILFERSIRKLLEKNISNDQKAALTELNYAYMSFIAECNRSFPREDVGRIVNLISAFHGTVGLFVDKMGEWKSADG